MKKLLMVIISLFLVIYVFSGCSNNKKSLVKKDADILVAENPYSSKTFNVGVEGKSPFCYLDDKNEYVGLDVDLIKEAGIRLGYKDVKIISVDWATKEKALDDGTIDALWSGLTITDELKSKMLFTDPYLVKEQVVYILADSTFSKVEDLKDKKVGIVKDSLSTQSKEELLSLANIDLATIVSYDNVLTLIQGLKSKVVDAIVIDEVTARQKAGIEIKSLIAIKPAISTEFVGVAVKAKNQTLHDDIQRILKNMTNDGMASQASIKWLGVDKIVVTKTVK